MNKGKARSEETKPNQENHRTLEFASIVVRDKPLKNFVLGISISDTEHPGVWGFLQLATGSLSDSIGRKRLIYPGMIVQSFGIWIVLASGNNFFGLMAGMVLLGVGTALVYPTLLAAISDIANPRWRATSLGVYRFWRDLGFVFGAVGIGFIADASGLSTALHIVAWISLGSGIFVLVFMRETRRQT
jgi:MFS family permease